MSTDEKYNCNLIVFIIYLHIVLELFLFKFAVYKSFDSYIEEKPHVLGFEVARIEKLPPVLLLTLLRFDISELPGKELTKNNERFIFYEKINLDKYLKGCEHTRRANYTLHAVLVHSGSYSDGGHYIVYVNVNPAGDSDWCEFNDTLVSACTKKEAIDDNFGDGVCNKNAYMLIYTRDCDTSWLRAKIDTSQIPKEYFCNDVKDAKYNLRWFNRDTHTFDVCMRIWLNSSEKIIDLIPKFNCSI